MARTNPRPTRPQHGTPTQSPNRPPAASHPQFRWIPRIEWILIPLSLLGMAYLLRHIEPVFSWESIMEHLHVRNMERYTRLGHLCLVGILLVAAVRIFGRR